jgi:hypothetical protein
VYLVNAADLDDTPARPAVVGGVDVVGLAVDVDEPPQADSRRANPRTGSRPSSRPPVCRRDEGRVEITWRVHPAHMNEISESPESSIRTTWVRATYAAQAQQRLRNHR